MNKKNIPIKDDDEWGNIELPGVSDEELYGKNWNRSGSLTLWHKNNPYTDEKKKKNSESNKKFRHENPFTDEEKNIRSEALKGKTLEEILGEERAIEGRKKRSSAHLGKKRPKEVGEKIAAARRENGSYDGRSMLGKEHKESTRATIATKAKVRQELKRELGLGRDGKIPKELLEARYKQLGI
jgi:hypothetical protein